MEKLLDKVLSPPFASAAPEGAAAAAAAAPGLRDAALGAPSAASWRVAASPAPSPPPPQPAPAEGPPPAALTHLQVWSTALQAAAAAAAQAAQEANQLTLVNWALPPALQADAEGAEDAGAAADAPASAAGAAYQPLADGATHVPAAAAAAA